MNTKNLKNPAKPVKLIHPSFEENFRSIRHAAGFLGSECLEEGEAYIHHEVISFLLKTGLTLSGNHPLSGLRVLEGKVFTLKKNPLNPEEGFSESREDVSLNPEEGFSESREDVSLNPEEGFSESLISKPLNHINTESHNQVTLQTQNHSNTQAQDEEQPVDDGIEIPFYREVPEPKSSVTLTTTLQALEDVFDEDEFNKLFELSL